MAGKKLDTSAPQERVDAGIVEKDFEPGVPEDAQDGLNVDYEALDAEGKLARAAGAPHAGPITSAPSAMQNPYMSEEEQGMEMRPTVVGPPGYGSPDPLTSAGRLVPLNTHPLQAESLPEGAAAAISEDYAEGYDVTLSGTQTLTSSPVAPQTDLERHSRGDFTEEDNAEVDATDAARDLANENGVNLNDVKGTGSEGRVTVDDVKAHLAEDDE